jgi:hypothetical protein
MEAQEAREKNPYATHEAAGLQLLFAQAINSVSE